MAKATATESVEVTAIESAIQSAQERRMSVFNVAKIINEKGILCPDVVISVMADCKTGTWKLFDQPKEGDITMSILKTERYFGKLSPIYPNDLEHLQIWFVAESGNLPKDTVMVTYIKERSLNAFNRLVASLMAERIEPSGGVFKPIFKEYVSKKVGTQYYGLEWKWEPRTDMAREQELLAVIDSQENQLKMIDGSISNRLTLLGEQTTQPKELTAADF